MTDIFQNYFLQREELLARIAQELQLDKTRLKKMESAYNAVSDLLKNDSEFFDGLDIEVYAQGSTRIGTTVKPIMEEDFDLDTVLHIYDVYYKHTPEGLYNGLVKALEKDPYYRAIMEKKKRCVRLNYKSDFHMDILPACMPNSFEMKKIQIPEKAMKNWSSGNPKGFAEWFETRSKSSTTPMLRKFSSELLEAQIETEPLPEELYSKTPLQRAVQLIKRYRDLYYKNRDYRASSIVITSLAAEFYNGEDSIFDAIDNIISTIRRNYTEAIKQGQKFKILNPVNPSEDFTDSWTNEHYDSFYRFINDFYNKWQNLKNSFETSNKDYIELFGEGIYKKSLNEQFRAFGDASKDSLVRSSALITGGGALTDSKGQINKNNGIKNEPHHSYGGRY